MRQHKTFPKQGSKKLKETIQDLKAYINELESRNEFLEKQFNNNNTIQAVDPEREKTLTMDEIRENWRKDFLRRIRENK